MRCLTVLVCVAALLLAASASVASAQKSVSEVLGRLAAAEGQPQRYLEELVLFSYVENSFVGNLGSVGRGDVNELRFYDHDNGYAFNSPQGGR